MSCQEFRARIGAEPNSNEPDVLAHVAQCVPCAHYREQLQATDRLIYRALQIDVRQPAADRAPGRQSAWRRPVWGIAASLLIALGVVALTWLLAPRASFAEQLIDHIEGEPDALVSTPEGVDAAELSAVLSRAGVRLKQGAARVSYARTCVFNGRRVPHLAVQTDRGPVTVLVLPDEPQRAGLERFEESGFQGVIAPAPRGVIAVLGENAPVDQVAGALLAALEYEGTGRPPW